MRKQWTRSWIFGLVAAGLIGLAICCLTIYCSIVVELYAADGPVANSPAQPPKAKTDSVVTDYFGTKVPDPYRWMEAGVEDPAVMDFLTAQNDYTRAVLAPLAAARDKLLARLSELDNAVPTVRSWQRAGTDIFYLETAPGASSPSLMVRGKGGEARKLLDPIQFEEKGSHAAIDYFAPSSDARYVLAGVSLGGSENSTIRVIEVKTGHWLPDAITRTQYAGPSWRSDLQSFYYARLQKLPADAPPTAIYENERTYLHILGSDPEKDQPVFGPGVGVAISVPKAGFTGVGVTPGSAYAIAFFSAGTTDPAALYSAPVDKAEDARTPWRQIVSPADSISPGADSSTAVYGSSLYLLVDKDAPNRKLISVDLDHPDIAHATVLIPPATASCLGFMRPGTGFTSLAGTACSSICAVCLTRLRLTSWIFPCPITARFPTLMLACCFRE